MRISVVASACLAVVMAAPAVSAQESPGAPPGVGELAPDFELAGATRTGQLDDPLRLSDYHGKTVVLAFFYRARTSG
jgi:hypothetical protein